MRIIGITGNIASGKNLISFYLRQLKYQVFDADALVHYLYENDQEVIAQVSLLFPQSLRDNKIDRKRLSNYLVHSMDNWRLLENIIHPIVMRELNNFLLQKRRQNYNNIAINIPLLFAIGADKLCDNIIVVESSKRIRLQRLANRENYNPLLTNIILKKQNHNFRTKKCTTIKTGLAKGEVFSRLYQILK